MHPQTFDPVSVSHTPSNINTNNNNKMMDPHYQQQQPQQGFYYPPLPHHNAGYPHHPYGGYHPGPPGPMVYMSHPPPLMVHPGAGAWQDYPPTSTSTATGANNQQPTNTAPPSPEQPAAVSQQEVILPHENDVLMGRGGKNNQHVGNERLREMARAVRDRYKESGKKEKSNMSRELVQQVRDLDPPGRFLKRNPVTSEWEDVGDDIAREKISQVLRDAVSEWTGPKAAKRGGLPTDGNSNDNDSGSDSDNDSKNSKNSSKRSRKVVSSDDESEHKEITKENPATTEQPNTSTTPAKPEESKTETPVASADAVSSPAPAPTQAVEPTKAEVMEPPKTKTTIIGGGAAATTTAAAAAAGSGGLSEQSSDPPLPDAPDPIIVYPENFLVRDRTSSDDTLSWMESDALSVASTVGTAELPENDNNYEPTTPIQKNTKVKHQIQQVRNVPVQAVPRKRKTNRLERYSNLGMGTSDMSLGSIGSQQLSSRNLSTQLSGRQLMSSGARQTSNRQLSSRQLSSRQLSSRQLSSRQLSSRQLSSRHMMSVDMRRQNFDMMGESELSLDSLSISGDSRQLSRKNIFLQQYEDLDMGLSDWSLPGSNLDNNGGGCHNPRPSVIIEGDLEVDLSDHVSSMLSPQQMFADHYAASGMGTSTSNMTTNTIGTFSGHSRMSRGLFSVQKGNSMRMESGHSFMTMDELQLDMLDDDHFMDDDDDDEFCSDFC